MDETVGIKIPLSDKDTFLDTYIQSMEGLAANTNRVEELSRNARKRAVEQHSWEARAAHALKIYNSL